MSVHSNIQDHIERFGVSIMGVMAGPRSPTFSYTIGLIQSYAHPEIMLFGLNPRNSQTLLNSLAKKIAAGKYYRDGDTEDDIANLPCVLKNVPFSIAKEYACQAIYWYEKSDFSPSFMQMVIPDRSGLFPWNKGYDTIYMHDMQPELWIVQ